MAEAGSYLARRPILLTVRDNAKTPGSLSASYNHPRRLCLHTGSAAYVGGMSAVARSPANTGRPPIGARIDPPPLL
jgi:hypothetical protein